MNTPFQYIPSGDSAFIIKVGTEISPEINRTIRKLLVRIEQEKLDGILDFVPAYNELMICYDPVKLGYRKLLDTLRSLEKDVEAVELPPASVVHVPVVYGGPFGEDLAEVAQTNLLSEEEVIRIHTSTDYLIYMLGFTPGFCYLGGMDERIATPRRQSPRMKIPAGAVGIADQQTGIYPIESPGGWQLIGRTPLLLFDPVRKPEFLFQAGDYIRFYPVTEEEFQHMSEEIKTGSFNPETTKLV